jgi:hypothetical protein
MEQSPYCLLNGQLANQVIRRCAAVLITYPDSDEFDPLLGNDSETN